MDQFVKLSLSQSFVQRALLRILTEPYIASNYSSFFVIFPEMICKIFRSFFFNHSHCSNNYRFSFCTLKLSGSFSSFLRSWYLVITHADESRGVG